MDTLYINTLWRAKYQWGPSNALIYELLKNFDFQAIYKVFPTVKPHSFRRPNASNGKNDSIKIRTLYRRK